MLRLSSLTTSLSGSLAVMSMTTGCLIVAEGEGEGEATASTSSCRRTPSSFRSAVLGE